MLKYFNIELNKKLTFAGRKKPVHGKSRICYTFTKTFPKCRTIE